MLGRTMGASGEMSKKEKLNNFIIWALGSMLREIGIYIYIYIYIYGAMGSMTGDIKKDARGH
jgi:hypothetical protein